MNDNERTAAAKMSWQYRAIEATRGNTTKIGCILIAVLGKSATHNPPRFAATAQITANGLVMAKYQDKRGVIWPAQIVCEADELVANFRGLADALKLADGERKELFAEIRKWITHDERANAQHLFNVERTH